MTRLFGREYTRQELLQRVGAVSQLGGTRRYELADGGEKGVAAVDVDAGSGFRFTVLPDRGMDISAASFKGRSLCWRSSTGETSPSFYEPQGLGWLRGFHGGLLASCGLSQVGEPCTDGDEELGLHGRLSYTPAKNVCHGGDWEGDEYTMFVEGKVTETSVFGVNLTLTRRISAMLGENRLRIHDIVVNHGFKTAPLQMLYHINLGFPVVDETSELLSPSRDVLPSSDHARTGLADYARFDPPTADYEEMCYYHEMKPDAEGIVRVGIVNRAFFGGRGIGAYVKYLKSELPRFTQWKMMGQGTYVTGVEPGNENPIGRIASRKRGSLQVIEPGEKVEFHLEIGVLANTEEIDEFEKAVKSAGA